MTTLVDERVAALHERARREIESGLLPSCQYALVLDGDVVVDETLGDATPGSRFAVFSATKPVVAAAAWILIQRDELDPSARVVDLFEEFMAEGGDARRDDITVEQVMLHTSGFPHAPLGPSDWSTREGRVERMARWRCNWDPGTAYEYHASSAHWVLAELIARISGDDHREFIRREVLDPLGLDRFELGVAEADQHDLNELAVTGEPPDPSELQELFGVPELPVTEVTDAALLGFNLASTRAVGHPGGGGFSTAADLARFHQALVRNDAGVWDDDLLADVTSKVRNSYADPLLGHPANRTLGLIVAGDDGYASYRGFGKTGSARTFGHNGAGGQLAWADPETGLSFAYLTNGLDAHPIRQARRGVALSSIAATCAIA